MGSGPYLVFSVVAGSAVWTVDCIASRCHGVHAPRYELQQKTLVGLHLRR